jgi:hypothetical protein
MGRCQDRLELSIWVDKEDAVGMINGELGAIVAVHFERCRNLRGQYSQFIWVTSETDQSRA